MHICSYPAFLALSIILDLFLSSNYLRISCVFILVDYLDHHFFVSKGGGDHYCGTSKETVVLLFYWYLTMEPLPEKSRLCAHVEADSCDWASHMGASDCGSDGTRSSRSGKWSAEEEFLSGGIIKNFMEGELDDCPEGCTMRAYLSKRLGCKPMRISKKFAGKHIGKVNCSIVLLFYCPFVLFFVQCIFNIFLFTGL